MTTLLLAVRGLEKTSEAFRAELCRLAARQALDPGALAAVMSFETGGTFSPSIKNPGSSATGLIQFMEATARRLGTSTAELAAMTAEAQLAYVEKYFALIPSSRVKTETDHYMAVFAPAGIGKPESHVLYAAPSAAYSANRALDRSGDGTITVGEAAAGVLGLIAEAKRRPPFIVADAGPAAAPVAAGGSLLGLIVFGAIAWAVARWKR